MSTRYNDVLVLCAAHSSPTPSCHQYLQVLQELGAVVQYSACYPEVSLTRCLQASAAYQVLQQQPKLQWVFWLDSDMCSYPLALEQLIMCAERLSGTREVNVPMLVPTVSGAYVNRHDIRGSTRLAAHALKEAVPIEVVLPYVDSPEGKQDVHHATRALVGMGCLLQHRSVFMAHCDESEHFCFPSDDYLVPLVCSSHRWHSSEMAQYLAIDNECDKWFWLGEDFAYCIHEIDHGREVYLVDVPWGHEFLRVTYPDAGTVFPGLKPPPKPTIYFTVPPECKEDDF